MRWRLTKDWPVGAFLILDFTNPVWNGMPLPITQLVQVEPGHLALPLPICFQALDQQAQTALLNTWAGYE
jgi:hypothetical protein